MSVFDLGAAATDFCNTVQHRLDAVLPSPEGADPDDRRVTARQLGKAFQVWVGVRTQPKPRTIPLLVDGEHSANLFLSYQLVSDSMGTFLAVERSQFELRDGRRPIVRLDYRRDMHTAPASHWNVHTERSAVTRMIVLRDPSRPGDLSELHLPNGGERMRPCLEDFLQMLIVDLGFDTQPDAREAIEEGREQWRRLQLAALVRDVPEVAIRVLEDHFGYVVTAPDPGTAPAGARRERTLRYW